MVWRGREVLLTRQSRVKLFECSHAKEWETLSKRWLDVENRVSRLELSEKDFRDKVLRKIQTRNEEEPSKREDLYQGVLLKE